MESIARDGLQQPVIVCRLWKIPGWKIITGHNRVEAARLLGWKDIPVLIRDLDDEQAALVVVKTNLEQWEKLLPTFLSPEAQQEVYYYFFQTETKGKLTLKNARTRIPRPKNRRTALCGGFRIWFQIQ